MRLELVRYHLGWLGIGLQEFGVDVEMSSAIAEADNEMRTMRAVESEIYRAEILRK